MTQHRYRTYRATDWCAFFFPEEWTCCIVVKWYEDLHVHVRVCMRRLEWRHSHCLPVYYQMRTRISSKYGTCREQLTMIAILISQMTRRPLFNERMNPSLMLNTASKQNLRKNPLLTHNKNIIIFERNFRCVKKWHRVNSHKNFRKQKIHVMQYLYVV